MIPTKGEYFEVFTGLVEVYSIDLGGYAHFPDQLLSLSRQKRSEVRSKYEKSFFEKYPDYKKIEPLITQSNTPSLYLQLSIFEQMRIRLLEIIGIRASPPSGQ